MRSKKFGNNNAYRIDRWMTMVRRKNWVKLINIVKEVFVRCLSISNRSDAVYLQWIESKSCRIRTRGLILFCKENMRYSHKQDINYAS